jgi:hypothetical protein
MRSMRLFRAVGGNKGTFHGVVLIRPGIKEAVIIDDAGKKHTATFSSVKIDECEEREVPAGFHTVHVTIELPKETPKCGINIWMLVFDAVEIPVDGDRVDFQMVSTGSKAVARAGG